MGIDRQIRQVRRDGAGTVELAWWVELAWREGFGGWRWPAAIDPRTSQKLGWQAGRPKIPWLVSPLPRAPHMAQACRLHLLSIKALHISHE